MQKRFIRSLLNAACACAPSIVLAACAPSFSLFTPPPRVPPVERVAPPSGQACLDELGRRGAAFAIVAEPAASGPCRLINGISLARSSVRLDRPVTMACPLAIALTDFELQVVQPAALRHLNRRVTLIRHYGAYECRNIRNTRRLSEHARGQAFDVAGFELDDGTVVSVKDHWRNAGARSRFLQDVAREACRLFSVVLTPKSDADHLDHFHFDIGSRSHCGA